MKPGVRSKVFSTACVVSLVTGVLLGSRPWEARPPRSVAAKSTDREPEPASGIEAPPDTILQMSPASRALMIRRAAASGETAALWDWLRTTQESPELIHAVMSELVDRLGWGAWDQVLEIDDASLRASLCDRFLWIYSKRDPWKAYEVWKEHRGDFADPHWGKFLIFNTVQAGALVSADKLIEVLGQMSSGSPTASDSFMDAEYHPDFDFEKVLGYLAAADRQPLIVPNDLLRKWAERSPAAAAEWLAAHFSGEDENQRRTAVESLKAIASSEAPDEVRSNALDTMSRLPAEFLDVAWKSIADQNNGKLDAATLEAAARMDRRDTYLLQSLLETRVTDQMDPSWTLVSAEERLAALKAAEEDFAADHASPVQARAFQRWRGRVAAAWGLTP